MNSKVLLLALLSMIIGFYACNKDDNEPENKIPLIKTETHYSDGHYSYSLTYEYDQWGKLTKETADTGAYSIYKHETGKIIKMTFYEKSNNTFSDTLLINENGLMYADKNSTYEYNTDGYLIKSISPDFRIPGTYIVINYSISNGNTIQKILNILSLSYKATYQFLANNNTIGNENMGKIWLGKQDKNLQAEEYWYDRTDSKLLEKSMYFSYETDTKNRVTKKTANKGTKDEGEYYIIYAYY